MDSGSVVGIFVNGEVLLPHAPNAGHRLNETFPIDAILARLLSIAGTPNADVHERVIARNWSDRELSSERSFLVGAVQRRLFQMLHVPVDFVDKINHPSYLGGTRGELDGALLRRARNWAARTLTARADAVVHVVLVGLDPAEPPDLPDGVIVHPVAVVNLGNRKVSVPTDVTGQALNPGRKLWIAPPSKKK